MNNSTKKSRKPYGLKKNEYGKLYFPLELNSYSDLASRKQGILSALNLITYTIWGELNSQKVRELLPNAIDTLTEILSQLNEIDSENFEIFDKMMEAN